MCYNIAVVCNIILVCVVVTRHWQYMALFRVFISTKLCMYYNFVTFSYYETQALSGLRFVDRKLPLTTIVRLCISALCLIILFCPVVTKH